MIAPPLRHTPPPPLRMRSQLYLGVVILLLAVLPIYGEGDDQSKNTVKDSNPDRKGSSDQDDDDDDDDVDDDDDDVPDALDDDVCDKLWSKAKAQEELMFEDEIVQWENLCAMKHGLCVLEEPYWDMGLRHSRIFFGYKHDMLMIKTRVSTTMDQRCESPEVNWEKIGEKYRLKAEIKKLKQFHGELGKNMIRGKKRHYRRDRKSPR